MKHFKTYLIVVLLAVAATGCYYDKAEIVYPGPVACDTANMTYTTDILPIMQARCYSCHAGTASGSFGIKLDSYNELKAVAQNGELVHRVTTTDQTDLMPKGGPRLPDCEIAKIRAWVQSGAPQ